MNQTEQFVMKFYQSININNPFTLSMEYVSDKLNMYLIYWKNTSALAIYNEKCFMFINTNLSKQKQWQDFGHEMYHYFFDETNYSILNESYAEYGETKADYFAYHFCVPSFMLHQFKEVSVYDVMELFNVEYDFALRRLKMYEHKVLSRRNNYARTYF